MIEQEERGPGFIAIPGTKMPKPPPEPYSAEEYAIYREKLARARHQAWLWDCALRDGRVKINVMIQGLQWSPIA